MTNSPVHRLIVGNVSTRIDPPIKGEHHAILKKKLGYQPEESFWMTRNSKFWDGWITTLCFDRARCRCVDKKDGMHFPTGSLSIVRDYFNQNGIAFKVEDIRPKVEKSNKFSTSDSVSLRDYQKRIVESAVKKGRGIIKAATGAGKTVISAALIAELDVVPAVFLVTSRDLMHQARKELSTVILENGKPANVGAIGGGVFDPSDITIMTVQTAVRSLGGSYKKYDEEEDCEDDAVFDDDKKDVIRKLIKNCKIYIADECIAGNSIVIIKKFGQKRIEDLADMVGEEILSFDGANVVWSKITNFYDKGVKEVMRITLISGEEIICTNNHLLMTGRGWIKAEDIGIDDSIIKLDSSSVNNLVNNSSHHLVDSSAVASKIKNIESAGSNHVFDISVQGTHCFFANNLLVHNCQHWAAETCQIVSNSMEEARYRFGVSATPWRDQGDDILIDGCFGKPVAEVSASELIRSKVLVKPSIYFIPLSSNIGGSYQDVYKKCIVHNEQRNHIIASMADQLYKANRKILVLVRIIEHGKMLEKMIPNSVFISGETDKKKRDGILEKMRAGYPGVVIASTIFDEGIDARPLDALILAGAGKSPTRALQRIGRVIRSNSGKKDAVVIDFFDDVKYLRAHSKRREKLYRSEPEFQVIKIGKDADLFGSI
jgi:superfamily II DNA or RNA helicase